MAESDLQDERARGQATVLARASYQAYLDSEVYSASVYQLSVDMEVNWEEELENILPEEPMNLKHDKPISRQEGRRAKKEAARAAKKLKKQQAAAQNEAQGAEAGSEDEDTPVWKLARPSKFYSLVHNLFKNRRLQFVEAIKQSQKIKKEREIIRIDAMMHSFIREMDTLIDCLKRRRVVLQTRKISDLMLKVFVYERSLGYTTVEMQQDGRYKLRTLFDVTFMSVTSEALPISIIISLLASNAYHVLIKSYESALSKETLAQFADYKLEASKAFNTCRNIIADNRDLFIAQLECCPLDRSQAKDLAGKPKFSIYTQTIAEELVKDNFSALGLVVLFYSGYLARVVVGIAADRAASSVLQVAEHADQMGNIVELLNAPED